jgi:glycosyltransferase involved in cell wall biosynthesis
MLNRSDILVIVPALNEEASIGTVVRDLMCEGFDVLVVNDGSTDQTGSVARSLGARVLDLPYNMGVGGALRAGFQIAVEGGYEAIVQVDADGQHPVALIDQLVMEANDSGAHMVVGSRFLSEDRQMSLTATRRLVMKFLAASATRAASTRITDSSSGFRLIRNPLLEQFSQSFSANYLGDTYEALVAAGRGGFTIREIPAPLRERMAGRSSASVLQSVQFTLKGIGVSLLRLHPEISNTSKETT